MHIHRSICVSNLFLDINVYLQIKHWCIYKYEYIYIYTCTCCLYMCTYSCMYIYIHIYSLISFKEKTLLYDHLPMDPSVPILPCLPDKVLNVYRYMYVKIYMHNCIYIHVSIYLYIYIDVFWCVYKCIYICMNVCIYLHKKTIFRCVGVHIYIDMFMSVHW
jgi:hypothetical protein